MFDLPSLHSSALTLASHVTLIVACLMVVGARLRMLWVFDGPARYATSGPVRWSFYLFFAALMTERGFYVMARLLKPYGVDLWSAHPAPDFLSFMVGATLFLMAVTTNLALMEAPSLAIRKSIWQALFLLTLWVTIALNLY